MTLSLALILFALLMIYCAVKGKSLRHALTGHAVAGGQGSVLQGAG